MAATKQEKHELAQRGAQSVIDAYRDIIKKYERRIAELELEILLNKKDWRTVEMIKS